MTKNTNKIVLICDDESNIREAIRYVVEKEDYTTRMAADGIAAYEAACSDNPVLVILDVGMPGMSGFDVCRKLRATGGLEQPRVLILTAFGQITDEETAGAVGADGFMAKPFSPRDLRAKINELMNNETSRSL